MKVRVPIANTPGKTAQIETDATKGATLGVNLYWPDGALVSLEDFAALAGVDPTQQPEEDGVTLWRLVLEVPENVQAVEVLEDAGIVRRRSDGLWTAAPLSNDLIEGENVTLEVGADGRITISAASPPAVSGELLVADGVSPPVMLTDDDETDFLYEG